MRGTRGTPWGGGQTGQGASPSSLHSSLQMGAIGKLSDDMRRHFRMKLRNLFTKFIRKFGSVPCLGGSRGGVEGLPVPPGPLPRRPWAGALEGLQLDPSLWTHCPSPAPHCSPVCPLTPQV